jgi:Uma2 family endonuclease
MSSTPFSMPQEPDYAWEVATLFPAQGEWTESAYLDLTDGTNKRVELTDRRLEFLPMPTEVHQALIRFLFFALYQFVDRDKLGEVYDSGLRVRLLEGNIRQPDIVFLHKDHFHLRHNRVWDGADLVMEVVSDDIKDRKRDYEEKLADYAAANIAEYWIADPETRTLLIHELVAGKYQVQGEHKSGIASSVFLPGFAIDVTKLFAVIDEIPE